MTKNNLYVMEQNLRSIAKKYKTVKYSIGLVILFLMMGLNAFSQDVMTTEEIAASRETLKNSVGNLQDKINTARLDNIEAYLANNKAVKPSENLDKLVEEGKVEYTEEYLSLEKEADKWKRERAQQQ